MDVIIKVTKVIMSFFIDDIIKERNEFNETETAVHYGMRNAAGILRKAY